SIADRCPTTGLKFISSQDRLRVRIQIRFGCSMNAL
ncbi:MAG: hypothetical protein ACI892_001632, partial [Marinobacter maritimus]